VISYHVVTADLATTAVVPLVYAAAMAAEAVAALATGWLHDRWGGGVLLVLPVMVAAVPALVFSDAWGAVLAGVLLWGAATGLQDSTVKALVAELVPAARRGTGYGMFAAVQGAAAVAGGALAGALYAHELPTLITIVAVLQVAAFALLVATLRAQRA
jgi:MFS family permease